MREETRKQGFKISGNNYGQEAQPCSAEWDYPLEYAMQRFPGSSNADAVLMRKDCTEVCFLYSAKQLQAPGIQDCTYCFSRVSGYAGMVVPLVEAWKESTFGQLQDNLRLWVAAGHSIAERFQARHLGSFLWQCVVDTQQVAHTSLKDASMQRASIEK